MIVRSQVASVPSRCQVPVFGACAGGAPLDTDEPPSDTRSRLSIGATGDDDGSDELVSLEAVERRYIERVLKQTDWVVNGPSGAAAVLGLHPSTLRARLKKLGIARPK